MRTEETTLQTVSRWTYEYIGEIPEEETLRWLADEYEKKKKPEATPLEEDGLLFSLWLLAPKKQTPVF